MLATFATSIRLGNILTPNSVPLPCALDLAPPSIHTGESFKPCLGSNSHCGMVFSTDLDQSLQSIGLQQYCQVLRNEGFETWRQLLDITEDDMIALDIKLGHRRRLQRAIHDAKQQAPDGVATNTLNHSPGSFRHDGPSGSRRSESTTQEDTTPTFHQAPPQKRKYRRHPKPDENAPERPPSAYVIFSNRVRERLKGQDLSFTEIAKIVGEQWQDPDPEERAACERQAQAMKETYYAQLTEYKKTPDYHIYQTYLVEFKAKHGEKHTKAESKRAKADCDLEMSITRSNSDEGMLDITSPRTDVIPVTGYTPSSRSSFTDGSTYIDSNITTVSISTGSNQSQSPLFARPSSMHASYRPQYDHTIDDRPWDSQTIPYREQSTAGSLIQDGNTGERGFRLLNGPSPYAANRATSASAASRIIPVEDTYVRRRSLLPSPTSPLDPRSRILPPPPGLGSKFAHPDSLQSSRPPQQPPNIPSARPHLAQRRSSLSLPPIRVQTDGYSDERRQPR